jgi:hypothetical protein
MLRTRARGESPVGMTGLTRLGIRRPRLAPRMAAENSRRE